MIAKKPAVSRDSVVDSCEAKRVPDHCLIADHDRLAERPLDGIDDIQGSERPATDEDTQYQGLHKGAVRSHCPIACADDAPTVQAPAGSLHSRRTPH